MNKIVTWLDYENSCKTVEKIIEADAYVCFIRKFGLDYGFNIENKKIDIGEINYKIITVLMEQLFPESVGEEFEIIYEPNKRYRQDTIDYAILDKLSNNRKEIILKPFEKYSSMELLISLIRFVDVKLYNKKLMHNVYMELMFEYGV